MDFSFNFSKVESVKCGQARWNLWIDGEQKVVRNVICMVPCKGVCVDGENPSVKLAGTCSDVSIEDDIATLS